MRFLLPLKPNLTVTNWHSNQTARFKSFLRSFRHNPTHLINLITTTNHTKILKHATQVHSQVILNDFTRSPVLFTNLLNLYFRCGQIDQSLLLFSTAQDASKNVVTWTSLVSQLTHFHEPFEALNFFNKMRSAGLYPNQYTFSAILPACAESLVVVNGGQVHCLIWKHGFGADLFVGSALIDMYAKCGHVVLAKSVFDEMPERNLVSWNSMIVGFLHNELFDRAIGLFKDLLGEVTGSVCPDEVSFSSVLSACANGGALDCGRQVHGVITKHGLLHLAYVNSSLMDMYCKCRVLEDAVTLFDILEGGYVVVWNVMIAGCCHNDKLEEACNYFCAMTREGVLPDEASYSSVLHASASLAALAHGTIIHGRILKSGLSNSVFVSASLITMYSNSGNLLDAYLVFEEVKDRNLICWTAIIAACQQHCCADQAIELFEAMLEQRIKPGYLTFVCIISACSHLGHTEEGCKYFNSMTDVYGMTPGHDHYACMVELLSRAGQLDEAMKFIELMPIEPNPSIWGALIDACANCGCLEIGEEVAEKLFQLEPDNPGNYLLLYDIYACNGKLKQADEVKRLMEEKGVGREPGRSRLDVRNSTFVFTDHDTSHPRIGEIHQMLKNFAGLGE